MKKRITDVLGIDTLPNYWDKRYVKNLDKLSRPVYEVERHEDVWLTLRDGVRLCVDVYLPKGAGKVPALVSWSAYSKEMQNIKRGAIPPESLLFDHSLEAGDIDYFVKRATPTSSPIPGASARARASGTACTTPWRCGTFTTSSSGPPDRTGAMKMWAWWATPTLASARFLAPPSSPPI